MIIRELIETALELLAEFVGVHGMAIGALAIAVAGLWYLREAADAFVVLARWARVGSIFGALLLALYIAGVATGVVESGAVNSLIEGLTN
ncbi:hypothetical protein BRC92_00380 [Halobacteriales archaeon QS_4_69_31]|nr:MAG: hypothetical protein BRC92_00380 [Halobacteriales archaeon QS_4_69_31]